MALNHKGVLVSYKIMVYNFTNREEDLQAQR